MRPHHLLEAALRLFALNGLFAVPYSIVSLVVDDPWANAHLAGRFIMGGSSVLLPVILYGWLLWCAPRLCAWMHDAGADPDRPEATTARVAVLRIGLALLGLESLAWAAHRAMWLVLYLAGHENAAAEHIRFGAIQLFVGLVMVLAAQRIARRVDRWGAPHFGIAG